MAGNTGKNRNNNAGIAFRHALAAGLWALLIAVPVGLVSQTVLKELPFLVISIATLILVIAVGVVFDVIGVAVTAAVEPPLHARAARGIRGAHRAVRLVRNAHQVASFCNDVVGDVSGALSGAIGVAIVYQLFQMTEPITAIVATTFMSALVASLIVGGKAYGKVYAIRESTEIVFQVGRLIDVLAAPFRWLRRSSRS